MYYLQSRYYDPAIGRFINADTFATTDANGFLSCNMFAYCENDPVNSEDPSGEFAHILIGALVGIGLQAMSDILTPGQEKSSIADYIGAAVSGAISATGIGIIGSVLANAAISSTVYLANCGIKHEDVDLKEWRTETIIGAASGWVGGKGLNGKKVFGIISRSKQVLNTAVSPKKIVMYTEKIISQKKNIAKWLVQDTGAATTSKVAKSVWQRIMAR